MSSFPLRALAFLRLGYYNTFVDSRAIKNKYGVAETPVPLTFGQQGHGEGGIEYYGKSEKRGHTDSGRRNRHSSAGIRLDSHA
jgi:hypothetical protein